MSLSNINHSIMNRTNPNDIFITPLELAKKHIDSIKHKPTDIWYDPFKNNGSYYNQFPSENKRWSEILENRNFFDFNEPVDVICSNPPYSLMDEVLKKSIELNPRVISYLIGVNNLTTRRIQIMENAGYKITYLHLMKVYKWFGMSAIVVWEKTENASIISYDRIVWK